MNGVHYPASSVLGHGNLLWRVGSGDGGRGRSEGVTEIVTPSHAVLNMHMH